MRQHDKEEIQFEWNEKEVLNCFITEPNNVPTSDEHLFSREIKAHAKVEDVIRSEIGSDDFQVKSRKQ